MSNPAGSAPGPGSLLDELIPAAEFSERHACEVEASPAASYAAVRRLTALEVWPLAPLMAVRALPLAIRHPRRVARAISAGLADARSKPLSEHFLAAGFIELGELAGREYVLGVVGRFWTLDGRAVTRIEGHDQFLAFDQPGYAKAAINFLVEPGSDQVEVVTETRVVTTSADARRAFARYWRVVHPGSALIRRSWLAAIRRRAERS